jgi:hypothetical protein
MTKELINKSVELVRSYRKKRPEDVKVFPASSLGQGVPTLKPAVYRDFSPMLKERFELFGRWETATHGHWLGLSDMEALWQENISDEFLANVKSGMTANAENWPNHGAALFRPDRLSIFAGDDDGYEEIYLLWLDFYDEPEVWAYDTNGESRYKDLEEYLKAYLSGDVSASTRSWRAQ